MQRCKNLQKHFNVYIVEKVLMLTKKSIEFISI